MRLGEGKRDAESRACRAELGKGSRKQAEALESKGRDRCREGALWAEHPGKMGARTPLLRSL